jgi:hypothetical protein
VGRGSGTVDRASTASLNQGVREAVTQLLRGVPLRYNCPLPLFVDSNPSAWTPFQRFTRASVLNFLTQTGTWIAEEHPQLLQWTLAEAVRGDLHYASGGMYGVGAPMVIDEALRLRIEARAAPRLPSTLSLQRG